MRLLVATILMAPMYLGAQWWDFPAQLGEQVSKQSEERWKISFDQRVRYETRTNSGFTPDSDISTVLVRTRVSLAFQPVSWLKFSGMMQDTRSPGYGDNAPSSVRDPADLQEAYFEIRPGSKAGFGMTGGRKMVSYGEGRLIGIPEWGANSRTYDHARVMYKFAAAHLEFLFVSPVKNRIDGFNRPVLGDRVWGTYDVFPEIFQKSNLEVYVLRHDQNRPGGFAGGSALLGTDKVEVNTFGGRLFGAVTPQDHYNFELALQNGTVGAADHRAAALDTWVKHRWNVGKHTLDGTAEYKYASGTKNPSDATHTSTFDQLYPSSHDKFGHQDLFGWRNIHNIRGLATFGITKAFALNVLYDSLWLASARDGLYNTGGKAILKSADGTAGRHVGEEADVFGTYKYKHFIVGAGYGHVFAGQFIQMTSPGAGPNYAYLFHGYSF